MGDKNLDISHRSSSHCVSEPHFLQWTELDHFGGVS